MIEEIVQEIDDDDDSSWGDVEDSYTLHLKRVYSVCSSISASTTFASLYDEDDDEITDEEWIDKDDDVSVVEEYCSSSELDNDDAVTTPSSCAEEPSTHEDETQETEIVSRDNKEASVRDREYRNLEQVASGENDKLWEAKKQNGATSKSAKKNKKYTRRAFLRSLSTLRWLGKMSSFRKKPKQ